MEGCRLKHQALEHQLRPPQQSSSSAWSALGAWPALIGFGFESEHRLRAKEQRSSMPLCAQTSLSLSLSVSFCLSYVIKQMWLP